MNMLAKLGEKSSLIPLNFNTGTLLDYGVGSFVRSFDDKHWVLDGGLSFTNGWSGRFQRFKTTMAVAMTIRSMERYPGSVMIIYDSELSNRDTRRMAEMSGMYYNDPVKREAHVKDLMSRIVIYNVTEFETLDEFLEKLKDTYYKEIDTHRKDYTHETPFPDPRDPKKARTTLVPTFVLIDSLTESTTRAAHIASMENELSSSKQNTVSMADGKAKNTLLSRMVYDAGKYGIVFVMTAQIGDKIDMSGRGLPQPKDIQFMKQADQIKGTGKKFNFLISASYVNESAKVLLNSSKECEFPYIKGKTRAEDVSEVTMVIIRDKTKGAGDKVFPVLSQSRGYDPTLSNFNLLRNNGFAGIIGGSTPRFSTALLPDQKVTRNTLAMTGATDYKFYRSLEIMAQLVYMQKFWNTERFDLPFELPPATIAEKLVKSGAIDEILASRGWWSYGYQDIPYMSLLDILEIAKKHI